MLQVQIEQISLLQSADDDDNSVTDPMRDHQIERRTTHSLDASDSGYTHPINKSFGYDDYADDEDVSILSRQSTVICITTTDLVLDQPETNSQRYSHSQLPRIVLHQSSPQEKYNNNITTTTSYGSFHDSPLESFTAPRAANTLDDSLDGTNNDTNISARSIIEGVSDMETDDNGEPIYSVLPEESNQANILNTTTAD